MRCLLLLAFIASPLFASQGAKPWPKSYGFNWLQPEQAQCQLLDSQQQAFKHCNYLAEGGFDGSTTAYLCTQDTEREYMLFLDAKTCQQQLDTLRANAP